LNCTITLCQLLFIDDFKIFVTPFVSISLKTILYFFNPNLHILICIMDLIFKIFPKDTLKIWYLSLYVIFCLKYLTQAHGILYQIVKPWSIVKPFFIFFTCKLANDSGNKFVRCLSGFELHLVSVFLFKNAFIVFSWMFASHSYLWLNESV